MYNRLKSRRDFIERLLKSKHYTLPERRDLLNELELTKKEIAKQESCSLPTTLWEETVRQEISDNINQE